MVDGKGMGALGTRFAKAIMLAPIAAYRWTIAPLLGVNCRHLPTCSDYAREAIEINGAWKGGWLTLARLCRCHPWGSHGLDPVPDLKGEHHTFAPWRYGRWRINPGDVANETR
jgi:putative membrane protein insertion efficiency factor